MSQTPMQTFNGSQDALPDQVSSWEELRGTTVDSIDPTLLPKDIRLPALPHAVTEFTQEASRPDFEIPKLAKIVEKDAGLTVALLKLVNSAAYRLSRPIRSVQQAISHIGINTARTQLVAIGMRGAMDAMESRLVHVRNFWCESLQRALFARQVAGALGLDPGLAFMGGLLQDFMLPILSNQFYDEYIAFLESDGREGRDLKDWEREQFGWDHGMLGAVLAASWHFPDDLLCALYFHHEIGFTVSSPDPYFFRLFPTALSALLPDQLKQCPKGMAELLRADSRCKALDLGEIATAVDEEQMSMAEGYDIPDHLTRIINDARAIAAHESACQSG